MDTQAARLLDLHPRTKAADRLYGGERVGDVVAAFSPDGTRIVTAPAFEPARK